MANNNVQNVRFLRNGTLFTSREQATSALTNFTLTSEMDGSSILARYQVGTDPIKTLVGYVYYKDASNNSVTIFDVDDASSDVDEKIRTAIEALDSNATSVDGKNVQVKVTETDGKITAVNITTDNTVNSGDVNTAITNAINKLDASDSAVPGQYVSQVSQADGKIAVVRVDLPSLTEVKETGRPIVAVSEDKGQVAASAGNINAEFVNIADNGGKFTAKTVEDALAEIAAEIDAMDKEASAVDGQVVTTVAEEDGKVTETKASVKNLQLGGYSKEANATGDIASSDTINTALSKLENKVGANKVSNTDHSIVVTEPTGAATTDIKVNINSNEKVIKLGDNGIYTNLSLVKVESGLTANVREKYQLLASDNSQIGVDIEIPKDSALQNVYLGHVDDKLTNADGQGESVDATITSGTGDAALVYVMQLSNGKYKLTAVNVESFLSESEFADGLQVKNHVVSVKVDTSSEQVTTGDNATVDVLTVGSNGVKVSNVQNAIDYAISTLDANVTGGTTAGTKTNGHIQVVVDEADGKLTAVTVNEANIADADKLADLSGKTVTEAASSNGSITATPSEAADGTKHLDIITDASKIKMSGFTSNDVLSGIAESSSVTEAFKEVGKVITENEETVSSALNDLETTKAEKTDLDAEIAARKAVDGQSGQTYAANTSANYISGATSLNDADIKLDAALKSLSNETVNQVKVNDVVLKKENNAVNAKINAAAGTGAETAAIAVNTDKSTGAVTISLLGLDCGTY